MKVFTAHGFAEAVGIGERAAQKAFKKGKWRGHALPIAEISGQQGGQSGRVSGLVLDAAPDAIRAKLNAYLKPDETSV